MNINQLLTISFIVFFGLRLIIDTFPRVDNYKNLIKPSVYVVIHSFFGLILYIIINTLVPSGSNRLNLITIPFIVIISGELTGRIFKFSEFKKYPGSYFNLFVTGLIFYAVTTTASFLGYMKAALFIVVGFLGLSFVGYSVYKNISDNRKIEEIHIITEQQIIMVIISLIVLFLEGLV